MKNAIKNIFLSLENSIKELEQLMITNSLINGGDK